MEYHNFSKEKGKKFAEAIVSLVDKKIKRVFWTNNKIDNWFGKRSAKEIIKNGTTCFMNSCFDLTLVSSYLLTQNNINNTFVIEEHFPTKEFNFNRLHFALNFTDKTGAYHINYKNGNNVYIDLEAYPGRKDIPQAQIIKISGASIHPDKPLHENLKYFSLEKLLTNITIGYSLEKNLQRLKEDNYKENYYQYKQKYGEGLRINLQPY